MSDDSTVQEIKLHMARAFFGSAWADACEDAGESSIMSGCDILDIMPDELDPAATRAADELTADMERDNDATIDELFRRACDVWNGDRDATPEMFGHYCAMQAMGTGVGLDDAAGRAVYEAIRVPYHEFGSCHLERDYFDREGEENANG